jgi:hypothetical protein
MAALDSLLICIFDSSIVIERSGIAAHIKDPANALIITQLSKLMPVSIRRRCAPAATKRSALNDGFLMLATSASDRAANSNDILCGRDFCRSGLGFPAVRQARLPTGMRLMPTPLAPVQIAPQPAPAS